MRATSDHRNAFRGNAEEDLSRIGIMPPVERAERWALVGPGGRDYSRFPRRRPEIQDIQ